MLSTILYSSSLLVMASNATGLYVFITRQTQEGTGDLLSGMAQYDGNRNLSPAVCHPEMV